MYSHLQELTLVTKKKKNLYYFIVVLLKDFYPVSWSQKAWSYVVLSWGFFSWDNKFVNHLGVKIGHIVKIVLLFLFWSVFFYLNKREKGREKKWIIRGKSTWYLRMRWNEVYFNDVFKYKRRKKLETNVLYISIAFVYNQ